ncbi:hypothetical protein [Pseudomonas chlororaphis]|uniref:hypothetical protein n=1 Tax=Pseudomonas chlororaphis TaxID=587753 RepID=UPI0039E19510
MNTNYNDRWISVTTSEGMFSSESVVEITLADGKKASLFVDKTLLTERAGKTMLRATHISSDLQRGTDLVLLPTETFQTASRWIELQSE